jgi:hypothetical protein
MFPLSAHALQTQSLQHPPLQYAYINLESHVSSGAARWQYTHRLAQQAYSPECNLQTSTLGAAETGRRG